MSTRIVQNDEGVAEFLRGPYGQQILYDLGYRRLAEPSLDFPINPVVGQQHAYPVSEDETWQFVYRGVGAYPWHAIGPVDLFGYVGTNEGTAATTYTNLATVGPSIDVPLDGIYTVEVGCRTIQASGSWVTYMAPNGAGLTAADSLAANTSTDTATDQNWTNKRNVGVALTRGTITAKYKRFGSGTGTFIQREMTLTPIRVAP